MLMTTVAMPSAIRTTAANTPPSSSTLRILFTPWLAVLRADGDLSITPGSVIRSNAAGIRIWPHSCFGKPAARKSAKADDPAAAVDVDAGGGGSDGQPRHRLHRPADGDDPARARVRPQFADRKRETRGSPEQRRVVRQRQMRLRDADREPAQARGRQRFGRGLRRGAELDGGCAVHRVATEAIF